MTPDLLPRLVDLYAGRELPSELEDDLAAAALSNDALAADMAAMRSVADLLASDRPAAYTEETRQRVLRRLLVAGSSVEESAPAPAHFQFALPIQG